MKLISTCALFALVAACDAELADPAPGSPEVPGAPLELATERWIVERGFDRAGVRAVADPAGRHHQLYVGAVPIWGLEAKVQEGKVRAPDVRFEARAEVDARPKISSASAEATALAALAARGERAGRVLRADLVLRPREELRLRAPSSKPAAGPASGAPAIAATRNAADYERVVTELTLIYRLELEAEAEGGAGAAGETRSWLAQVEAGSGKLLELAPVGASAAVFRPVMGFGAYVGKKGLSTLYDAVARVYLLRDSYGNTYEAYDGGALTFFESDDTYFGDGHLFTPGNPTDGPNGETAAVDAFYAVGMTWRFFSDVLGRSGPNGLGIPIKVRLHHVGDVSAQYLPYRRGAELQLGYTGTNPTTHELIPAATTDIVAHELGHDFFMTEVYGSPATAPTANSELRGMNEATGDIVGMLTEMVRDVVQGGQPAIAIDTLPLLQRYTDMAEQTGTVSRNLLTPTYDEWFPSIGAAEPHSAGGPIGRMFVLLAYGCQPASVLPPTARSCARVPNGFSGLGPITAARLWAATVTALPEGASFAQARQLMLDAATTEDRGFGGPKTKAVADAFAAVNVGTPADRTAPFINSFTCFQALLGIACTAQIGDAETPFLYDRAPQLVLDGFVRIYNVTTGWSVDAFIPGTDLSNGPHTIMLRAWDLWDNQGSQTVSVTYDGQPPTASLAVSGPVKHPTLQVTASDPSGVGGVSFYDGTQLLEVLGPPYTKTFDTTTMTEGDHTIFVKVADVYGNTVTLQTVLHVDNTAPTVTLHVSAGPPPFQISASVSDASSISRVDLLRDGSLLSAMSPPSYLFSYTPTDAAGHTLTVLATDALGNQGTASIAAPQDSVPPVVTFSSSQLGLVVTLVTGVSDSCGIANPWVISVDGLVVVQPTGPSYVLALGTSLAVGTHVFQAVVADRCGNSNDYITTFTKVSNVPPVITGVTRDDTMPKKPKFTVQCVDPDGIRQVEMRRGGLVVQSDTTAPYEFIVDTTGWPDGDDTVLFQCQDNQLLASDPVTRTVTADNTGPTFVFNVYGAGHSYQVFATGVTDSHGIQSVQLMGGLIAPTFNVTLTASPYQYNWIIPAAVNLQTTLPFWVVAKDQWGNEHSGYYNCYMDTHTTQPVYLSCAGG